MIRQKRKKMKKFIVIAVLFCSSLALFAQDGIKWYTLTEAVELNKAEPRNFVIDVYTDWCGWCKRMDAQTFSNQVVADFVNANYYPVKFNAEQREALTLGDKTYNFVSNGSRGYHEMAVILTRGRLSYPTIVYLDKDLRHLDVVPGFVNARQFEAYLAYFHERADKKTTFDKFSANFEGKVNATN